MYMYRMYMFVRNNVFLAESEEAAVVYATENITISEQSFTKARNK